MQRDLVARAQQGDRDAFAAIARASAGRLHATAQLILRHPDRADDAVQDALVEAWRDIRGLRDPEKLDAWLHRLLVRSCHRHARRDRRRSVVEIELGPTQEPFVADGTRAIADRDEMGRAFRRLDEGQRTVLALIYYADLSQAEAALAMGVPVGTVKSRLNRAMHGLRAALAAEARTPALTKEPVA
jgi:RNA polymerase sigma-70 factor (ECF subfamily)